MAQLNARPPRITGFDGTKAASERTLNPWTMVFLLMLIGILNYLDRTLPSVLAEPIRKELALSDTALGLINGLGFTLIYALVSLPIARISDKGRYNVVIMLSLSVWSALTFAGGMVTTGWQLAVSRMGVASGEAGAMPAAHVFITRNFPSNRRSAALSVFTLCLPLGAMAGFVLGGYMGQHLGWRQTFLLMGALGLTLAGVFYLVVGATGKHKQGGEAQTDRPAPPVSALLRKRSVIAIIAGSSFMGAGGYSVTAFTPAFLMRSHGMTVSEAGLRFGLVGGAESIVALLLVGWLSGKLAQRDPRWLIATVIALVIVALPISIASFSVTDKGWAVAALSVNYIVAIAYSAPIYAAMHRLAPIELRGRASALMLLATSMLGGLGPLLTGVLSDRLAPQLGSLALGRAMLLIPAAYLAGVCCYGVATLFFRSEIAEED